MLKPRQCQRAIPAMTLAALVLAATLASCVHVDHKSAEAAAELRQDFFKREYQSGYEAGRRFMATYPADASIVAWFAPSAARSGHAEEAVAAADAMLSHDISNGWAQFAKAAALLFQSERGEDCLRAAAEAYSIDSQRPDFIWVYSEALRLQGHLDDADALLKKHEELVKSSSHLLVIRGSIAFDRYLADKKLADRRSAALEDFLAAERLDETSVDSYFAHAWFLDADRKNEESFEIWRRASQISSAMSVRQSYWWSALNRLHVAPSESKALIQTDITRLLESRPRDPDALAAAANGAQMLEDSASAAKYQERILELNIPGQALDQVKAKSYFERLVKLPSRNPTDAASADELRLENEIVDFLSAPSVNSDAAMGASQTLIQLVQRSSSPSARSLHALAEIFRKGGDEQPILAYVMTPRLMADHGVALDDAERLTLQGKSSLERKIEHLKQDLPRQATQEYLGLVNETLGWVWFKQGKLDAAERQLALAAKTPEEVNPYVYPHLASLYLEKGESETAMLYLERCFTSHWSSPNPCVDNLHAYFRMQKHNAKGEDAWVQSKAKELQGGKVVALSERYRQATRKLKPFTLATLDGRGVKSEDLRGKILVLSFWGAWCGACMVELPELQAFASQHEKNADLVFLTINNDPDIADARKAAAERKLTIETALDDGYAAGAGVYAFPTTWVIGPDQQRRLELRGLTPNLAGELESMVEAVRKSK